MDKPRPIGDVRQDSREESTPDTKGARFALSEYATDFHFFNPGAFFSYAGFTYPKEDPVSDWYATQPMGTELLLQPFQQTIIEGMVPITGVPGLSGVTWGQVICGVHHEQWPSLHDFLNGAVAVDRKKKLFAQPFSGDVTIFDPVLVERHSLLTLDLPTITLTVFCTDGNDARWEVRPPRSPLEPCRMVELPARPVVIEIAQAVLSGDFSKLQDYENDAFIRQLAEYQKLTDATVGKELKDAIGNSITDEFGRRLGD